MLAVVASDLLHVADVGLCLHVWNEPHAQPYLLPHRLITKRQESLACNQIDLFVFHFNINNFNQIISFAKLHIKNKLTNTEIT